MYTCSPTEVCLCFVAHSLSHQLHLHIRQNTFSVYANDAVFHDPVGIATGPKSIQAQFIALAKVCLSLEEEFSALIALSCFLEQTYRNSEYWRTPNQPLIM